MAIPELPEHWRKRANVDSGLHACTDEQMPQAVESTRNQRAANNSRRYQTALV